MKEVSITVCAASFRDRFQLMKLGASALLYPRDTLKIISGDGDWVEVRGRTLGDAYYLLRVGVTHVLFGRSRLVCVRLGKGDRRQLAR